MIEPVVIENLRTGMVEFWVGAEAQAYTEWLIEKEIYRSREMEYDSRDRPNLGSFPTSPNPTSAISRSEALLLAAKFLVGPMGPTGAMGASK